MIDLGHFCLVAAFLTAAYGLIFGGIGAYRRHPAMLASAQNSVYLCAAMSLIAFAALAKAFLTHQYQYVYVWQTSNNDMLPVYLFSAIWGGMDGSMLLWAVIMSGFAAAVVARSQSVPRDLMAWVVPVLSGATGFFLLVVTFLTNPFRLVPAGTPLNDGNGLNPLLQNPSMMIHPPMLYIGFTGFVVPFAFCIAALLSGNLSDSWIRLTRRWTLISWAFLTAGIILGGNWAYIELGWGGFWAWDPVENASFLPWLTGTAFLHSVMVQERRGMLKVWNVCLSVATYGLTVFGTFLTRSGVVQSVHAFAETDVGWVFLLYLGLLIVLTAVLLFVRWDDLRPENELQSYFSREAAFLFNNLALLGICFATFWGVMFPVISEAVAGEKSVVGPPFFNQVNVPLFLALLFLMGAGPLISWRRASWKGMKRVFVRPLIAGSICTIVFIIVDPSRIYPAVAFGLCVYVLGTIEGEFRRAVKVRRQTSNEGVAAGLVSAVRRKPRRYGGFLVHLGVAIMAIAITASMAYKTEKDITLKVGEQQQVGRYLLKLTSLKQEDKGNYTALVSEIEVRAAAGNEVLAWMYPERRNYKKSEEITTEVELRITPREDLYLALTGLDVSSADPQSSLAELPALFKVFINPLQVWLWFGGVVVLLGSLVLIGQGMLQREPAAAAEAAAAQVRA